MISCIVVGTVAFLSVSRTNFDTDLINLSAVTRIERRTARETTLFIAHGPNITINRGVREVEQAMRSCRQQTGGTR